MIYIKKLYTTLRYQPDRENQTASRQRRPYARHTPLNGASAMPLNSLFRSLLAAYACGASGTYESPGRED
ncbi:hypothetical protein PCL1606_55010 [Pseudomonas chlororaphis]|uniref:Uncharacterized protein n=1 Tax=Pseudomonas chlororaphis TaxID=587753 RepID=A0A0D5Y6L4_9PSED|nr:hypothetical protein PCL1606_55010 [Pseudomonas chlororaphis]